MCVGVINLVKADDGLGHKCHNPRARELQLAGSLAVNAVSCSTKLAITSRVKGPDTGGSRQRVLDVEINPTRHRIEV